MAKLMIITDMGRSLWKLGLMTLRNYYVMYAWKPPKFMIFLTSLYFHKNTFVVLIKQNTYKLQQNSVINMTYVAMTTHIPWLPHNVENIRYTIPKDYNLWKNVELCILYCLFYQIHIKNEETHFVWVVSLITHQMYVETNVMTLTSKHTCMTLITSHTETALPAWFQSPYLSNE